MTVEQARSQRQQVEEDRAGCLRLLARCNAMDVAPALGLDLPLLEVAAEDYVGRSEGEHIHFHSTPWVRGRTL